MNAFVVYFHLQDLSCKKGKFHFIKITFDLKTNQGLINEEILNKIWSPWYQDGDH